MWNLAETNLMCVVQCVVPIMSVAGVGVRVGMSMGVGVGMTVDKVPV